MVLRRYVSTVGPAVLLAACGSRTGLRLLEMEGLGGVSGSAGLSASAGAGASASAGVGGSGGSAGVGGSAGGGSAGVPATGGVGGMREPAYVVDISAGWFHTCALSSHGEVKCWGMNESGQLGIGDAQNRGDQPGEVGDELPFVALPSGRWAKSIACGTSHSCALLEEDRSVVCWGYNLGGQLGIRSRESRGDAPNELGGTALRVELGAGAPVFAIAAGGWNTCAVRSDGTAKCWGANDHGQLGQGRHLTDPTPLNPPDDSVPPIDLGSGVSVRAVSVGNEHVCVITETARVKCWGRNDDGQLGLGDSEDRGDEPGEMGDALPFVDLGPGRVALSISTGDSHTCALLDDAKVRCWGSNDLHQLDRPTQRDHGTAPGHMGTGLSAVAVGPSTLSLAARESSSCAFLDDGALHCWGRRLEEFGYYASVRASLAPRLDFGDARRADKIAIGVMHACVLLTDGTLRCWGYGNVGQIGRGDVYPHDILDGDATDVPRLDIGF